MRTEAIGARQLSTQACPGLSDQIGACNHRGEGAKRLWRSPYIYSVWFVVQIAAVVSQEADLLKIILFCYLYMPFITKLIFENKKGISITITVRNCRDVSDCRLVLYK